MYTFLNVAARIHQGMSQYLLECELEQKDVKGYQNFKMRKKMWGFIMASLKLLVKIFLVLGLMLINIKYI